MSESTRRAAYRTRDGRTIHTTVDVDRFGLAHCHAGSVIGTTVEEYWPMINWLEGQADRPDFLDDQ
jgi:hypothetical protein